jgi:D-xylonolactonase
LKAELICDGFGLIEGPVWYDKLGLLFSDVLFGGVFCLDKERKLTTVFEHRKGIGGMCLHEEHGMVVSGRNIAYKPLATGETIVILDRDEAQGRVGFNDITVDSKGRIYAGSLGSSPVFDDGLPERSGDLYLIENDGSSRVVARDIRLTNGLGFSPDGNFLYHSDSRRNTVYRYRVSSDGTLAAKEHFITTSKGIPDGLAVAQDGSVWVALADGGGGVAVFENNGQQTDFIDISVPMCTSVCFGGADGRDVYIVSGSDGTGSERAGGVYLARSGVPGLQPPPARVALY